MEIIKKWTAIKVETTIVDSVVKVDFIYGEQTGPRYGLKDKPKEEHDTEDKAIEYAFKEDWSATWLIVPVVRFKSPAVLNNDLKKITREG